ncbi:transcriptional regulator NrdR, partial [Bacillus anthracis]
EGTREEFNKEKILRGLIKACEKRPVSLRQLEEVTQSVERELRNLGISEVKSDMIGEIVMEELRDIDDVAYVRFASVYRQFKDLNVFIEELKDILQKERE